MRSLTVGVIKESIHHSSAFSFPSLMNMSVAVMTIPLYARTTVSEAHLLTQRIITPHSVAVSPWTSPITFSWSSRNLKRRSIAPKMQS
eukprot:scaffold64032_cov28-Attheya_sp.AAC.1